MNYTLEDINGIHEIEFVINTENIFSLNVDIRCFCEKCNYYHLANEKRNDCFPLFKIFDHHLDGIEEPLNIRAKDVHHAIALVGRLRCNINPIMCTFKVLQEDGTIIIYAFESYLSVTYNVFEMTNVEDLPF